MAKDSRHGNHDGAKALPEIDEVFAMARQRGLPPRRWGGSRLKTYNGFDHELRVRKWQALDLAVKMGLEIPADRKPCGICGIDGPGANIAYHSEDYGSMNGHHALCKSCHSRVHFRFANPSRWQQFIAPYADGSKWFEKVSMIDGAPAGSHVTPPAVLNTQVSLPPLPSSSVSTQRAVNPASEMRQLRIDFVKAMGIKSCDMNPDPVGGYKLEWDVAKRETCLWEARRLRNRFEEQVVQTGQSRGILEKMDSNLANRDRGAVWR